MRHKIHCERRQPLNSPNTRECYCGQHISYARVAYDGKRGQFYWIDTLNTLNRIEEKGICKVCLRGARSFRARKQLEDEEIMKWG